MSTLCAEQTTKFQFQLVLQMLHTFRIYIYMFFSMVFKKEFLAQFNLVFFLILDMIQV